MSSDNYPWTKKGGKLLERYTDQQKIEVFVLQGLMSIRNLKFHNVRNDRINLTNPKNRQVIADCLLTQERVAYRKAREERESVMKISSYIIELYPDATLFYALSYSYLSHAEFEEMIVEAEEKERKASRAYRKAKNHVRSLLRKYWIIRIRFASRAIGNINDFSLVTMPTPPTTTPTDENNLINVHQWGGALVGYLN